ncbi:hypothetical protein VP01_6230g1, partial [Puccinia sorghi]
CTHHIDQLRQTQGLHQCFLSFLIPEPEIQHLEETCLKEVWMLCQVHHYSSHPVRLFEGEDMQSSRLPPCVAKWLDDWVLSGDKWKNIHKDIWCPKVLALEGPSTVSEGRCIGYDW